MYIKKMIKLLQFYTKLLRGKKVTVTLPREIKTNAIYPIAYVNNSPVDATATFYDAVSRLVVWTAECHSRETCPDASAICIEVPELENAPHSVRRDIAICVLRQLHYSNRVKWCGEHGNIFVFDKITRG